MLNWDDVRVFVAVARAGGLAGATVATQLSAPTLGRRIVALERELGVTLFDRHRLGYSLTSAGQELLERSNVLEQGAIAIERWRTAIDPRSVVKIAAGSWTSFFLSQRLEKILPDKVRIEFVTGIDFLDLSRREANLGIRNIRPHQMGLAGRKVGQFGFAIYSSHSYVKSNPDAVYEERFEVCEWIMLSSQEGNIPSSAWLERKITRPARMACSYPHAVLGAVAEGAGLCILPCFIGDYDARLVRVSDEIDELANTRWLVSHDDDRHNKPIRQVADRLAKLFLSVKPIE